MTAKQLVQERLPRWSEEQAQRALQAAEEQSEPNGADDEGRIHALQEVFETFASMDFLPREDAWH
jgi:hypothetical protein